MLSEMKFVIRVAGLGKKYLIRHQSRPRYETLRDTLAHGARRLLRKNAAPCREDFWALRDVTIEVKPGDKLGIIGRNGAGKTTLLKILSRITEPSAGRAEIRGRVASLLEVGTGFHPELTGRENIFLNGAILGMRRHEIARKFDEIVTFAEVEKFLDTPVKRYSSGMYVRLAFAVAAHLEPEILIIDEVLAVGDAQFQKKCLGKMGDVTKEGRTVLFVSHNLGAIETLCDAAILLDRGRLQQVGETHQVIAAYLSTFDDGTIGDLRTRTDRSGSGKARITAIGMKGEGGEALQQVLSGQDCTVTIDFHSSIELVRPTFRFTIYNSMGQPLLHFNSSLGEKPLTGLSRSGCAGCRINKLPLAKGNYRLNASLEDSGLLLDHVNGAYSFAVDEGNFYGAGRNVIDLKEICLAEQEWLPVEPRQPAVKSEN